LIVVSIVLRRLGVAFRRDDEATTSDSILGSDNVVVISRDAHIRTGESDRYFLSFTGRQSIGIKLICASLVTYLQTRKVRISPHHRLGTLHLASVANSDRQHGVSAGVKECWHGLGGVDADVRGKVDRRLVAFFLLHHVQVLFGLRLKVLHTRHVHAGQL